MQDDDNSLPQLSRRLFLATSAGSAVLLPQVLSAGPLESADAGPYQATGVRVGEVADRSAIVWARLTKHRERNNAGIVFADKKGKQRQQKTSIDVPVADIEGACPGAAGRVRLIYGSRENMSDAIETDWVEVTEETDFTHQFQLTGLTPGQRYCYATQTAGPGDDDVRSQQVGDFQTAPEKSAPSSFRFCVMTCQGYPDRDHVDGHPIYPSMLALKPAFLSLTGDLVYYDNDAPSATTPALARLHWERMFSLPRLVKTLRHTSTYWLKDDHDTLANDAWPGMNAGELSFAAGQEIFRQQAPMGESSYRTFRWGRDLQIWLTDGRDFRSPNNASDGSAKTIWGANQKAWFQRTVAASDATWKVLLSPTPLVGPDRPKKNDNHSNDGFDHEGRELRQWLAEHVPDNFFVVCGDRHWQYHSVHPTTGTQEFSVGPASDSHAGGTPGEDPAYHRFHRVKGGFLSVELSPEEGQQSRISFQLRDVDGAIVYEATFRRAIG